MAGTGGKGRISNQLVAASCAAVLAVYAAGYWRTRDEARRIEPRAQQRRPVQPVTSPATSPTSVAQPQMVPPASAPPAEAATKPVAAVTPPPKDPLKAIQAISPTAASTPAAPAPAPTATPQIPASVAAATLAAEPVPAPTPDALPAPAARWRDGTYTGWGTSRHGDIKAQVVIRDGRIVEAGIASCETRYPCDVIGDIIAQPVARQSPEVDAVSRATESADAYYYGLVEALKEALIPTGQEPAQP